jgi:hypothetical protein
MNYSLLGADRATHLKIALIALVAVVVVVVAVINAHVSDTRRGTGITIDDAVVKAGKPAAYTIRESSTIR